MDVLCGGILLLLNQAISKNSEQNFKRATYPKMFRSIFLGGCVVCLAGARSLLRQEKKVLVICLAGAQLLLRPEKKVLVVYLAGA